MSAGGSDLIQLMPSLRADLSWVKSAAPRLAVEWEAGSSDGLWPLEATRGREPGLCELLIESGEVQRGAPDRVTILAPFVRGGRVVLGEDVSIGGCRAWRTLAARLPGGKGFRLANRRRPSDAFEVRVSGDSLTIVETQGRTRGRTLELPAAEMGFLAKRSDCALDDFEHRLRVALLSRHDREAVDRYLYALMGLGTEPSITSL